MKKLACFNYLLHVFAFEGELLGKLTCGTLIPNEN